jgi:tripartite ATP-independent transporter DctP family solute receptor
MGNRLKAMLAGIAASGLLTLAGAGYAAEIKERSLKVGFVQAKDHPQGLALEKFAEAVARKSDGKLKVRIFGDGTLGGDAAVISSLQGGTVEMTLVATGLLTGHVKDFGIFDLPFLFNDYAEADAVLDGPIGKKLMDKLPEKGLVGLTYWDHGFRNLTNSRRPVAKAEDIQGLKIRVLQLPIHIAMFNTLGANAVPMPFPELYTALETRTVDGQENTFSSIESSKFNEVQKFVSVTNHVYQPLILLFSKKSWDQLSGDERKILTDAGAEVQAEVRKISRDANSKALERLKASGMTANEVAPEVIAQMRAKLKPVTEKHSKELGEALVNEMQAQIEAVRRRK